MAATEQDTSVRFLFDPRCPWTWRASQWLRQVQRERGLPVQWDVMSLEYVNRNDANTERQANRRKLRPALRLLELTRRQGGNAAVGRLYEALGQARHERGEDIADPDVLRRVAGEAGLDAAQVTAALEQEDLDADMERRYASYEEAGALGSPTVWVGDTRPFYGPVMDKVPPTEESGALWDDVVRMSERPYFFELKRSR